MWLSFFAADSLSDTLDVCLALWQFRHLSGLACIIVRLQNPHLNKDYSPAKVAVRYFQYFCTELICTFSSGEWAPLMLGPKLIISMPG